MSDGMGCRHVGQQSAGELQLARDARHVVDRHDRADHCRNVDDARRSGEELFFEHRRVRCAEEYERLGQLADSSARSNRLIREIYFGPALRVLIKPVRVDRIRERGAGARDRRVLRLRGRGAGSGDCRECCDRRVREQTRHLSVHQKATIICTASRRSFG